MSNAAKEIKSRITPAEAIERYTGQRPMHNKYICPFHHDKHPSLSVKGNIWRCWSCDEHGDVIDFTRMYFNLTFGEALQKLADDFSVDVKVYINKDADPLEKLWHIVGINVAEHNRLELENYRAEIDAEIDDLTTVHRVLFHNGASEETLARYAAEIDCLIAYRERI